MPSPPRPLRHSPPRKPLHERSESSTNERTSPTVRIIGDPHATVYSSTPFPTHPSHILPPKTTRPSGAVLEEVGVSDQHNPTYPEHVSENILQEVTRTTTVKAKETDESEDTNNGSSSPPWPLRNSKHFSPAPNVPPESVDDYDANDRSFIVGQAVEEGRPSEEIVQLPSVESRPDTPGCYNFNPSQTSYQPPVAAKSSDGSLSSAESTGTVIRTKPRDRPNRASYSAFPSLIRQDNSRANSTSASPTTPVSINPRDSQIETSPISPVSPESPAAAFPLPPATGHRTVSLPQSHLEEDVHVQYPTIRAPSASESWAESLEPATRPPRNPNRARWNPHLSTVESVRMTDRSSGSLYPADASRGSKSSTRAPNSRSETPSLPAFPRSAYSPQIDITTSTIRVVDEQDDYVDGSLAPVPGSRGSNRLSIFSGSSRGENRRSAIFHSTRPSSRGSFFRDSIPAWAKAYYGRGGRNSMLPQNYSNDNVQDSGLNNSDPYTTDYSTAPYTTEHSASETSSMILGLHQPRTRPRDRIGHSRNDSLPITRIRPSEINVVEVRGAPRVKISDSWSPHLWQHRTSVPKRRSLFIAPAIDQYTVSRSPKRRNIQVVLFTVGFVFPLGMLIVSHMIVLVLTVLQPGL